LTEEEAEFLKSKRERVKKKDIEETVAVKGGAKGKPPPKVEPKKATGRGAEKKVENAAEEENQDEKR